MTKGEKKYGRIDTKRIRSILISISSLLFIFLLWVFLAESGIVRPLYFPHPEEVIQAIVNIGPAIFSHIFATMYRILAGFFMGVFLGVGIGLWMSYNNYVYAALNYIIESWRPIPPVALLPFFILWFGFSDFGKIFLVTLGCALIMVVNTIESVRNVKPIYLRAAYSLGADKKKAFQTVIIPGILPELKSGLRISIALSVSLVIVSEFMGANQGLGYLINISKITFSTQTILFGIFLIGLISAGFDFVIRKLMDHLTKWSEKSEEALGL